MRDDLKRVCVEQTPLSQIFKNRSLPITIDQNKIKGVKLKVKIIGRSVKVETHDMMGTFMVLTRVFSKFSMEIQKAVLDTEQGMAINIFYLRPKDVHDIMENQNQFLRTLEQALQELIESKEILFDDPHLANPIKQTLAI